MRRLFACGKQWSPGALALGLILLLGSVQPGFALTFFASPTAFTYQGSLSQSGAPATGSFDLQFKLFNVSSGGVTPLATQTITGVAVTKGQFTVTLDFGSAPFNGDARWVQIGVRPSGTMFLFTALTPYQRLTATPYAIHAATADTATTVPWTAISGIPNKGEFLSQAGPDVLNSTSTQAALAVNQFKTGYAGMFTGSYGTTLYAVSNAAAPGKPSEKTGNIIPISPIGVQGRVTNGGYGVEGWASSIGTGVYGRSANGTGVYGYSSAGGPGGYFYGANINDGVFGNSVDGIGGHFTSASGPALQADGSATITQNLNVGGQITASNNNMKNAVAGAALRTNRNDAGVVGISGAPVVYETGDNYLPTGVRGESHDNIGIIALSDNYLAFGAISKHGTAVYASSGSSSASDAAGSFSGPTGVYASGGVGYAGNFNGPRGLYVNGGTTLTQDLNVGGKIKYTTPHTHVTAISHLDFHPYTDGKTATYAANGTALTSGNGILCASAKLPDHATITKIEIFYNDTNAASDISTWMYRSNMKTGNADAISSMASSSGSGGYQSKISTLAAALPDGPLVDNSTYTYNFSSSCTAWDPANLRLLGAQITYTTTEVE